MSDPPADRIHLFDANAIIEAVRTGVRWLSVERTKARLGIR